jgi:hypothetical protein
MACRAVARGGSRGPPLLRFGAAAFTRCASEGRKRFDGLPSRSSRRLARPAFAALRRGSLHSLRERRLVGGRGIEPLTPSMSRKCPGKKRSIYRLRLFRLSLFVHLCSRISWAFHGPGEGGRTLPPGPGRSAASDGRRLPLSTAPDARR